MKIKLQEIAAYFFQNILYKTLFATNFVENTCKFYNFVGNNYSEEITCQLKFLKKIVRKSLFL